MNNIISFTESQKKLNQQGEQTMSSREIAVLSDKAHRNVKRDIQVMCEKMNWSLLKFAHTYINPQNRQEYTEYNLPKFESEVLITGYDIARRAAVIQRWHDLETGKAKPKHAPLANAERLSSAEQRINDIEHQLEDPTSRIHLTEPPEGYACASVLQEFIPYSFAFVKKTVRYFKLTPVYYILRTAEGESFPVRSYHIEDFLTAAELVEEEAFQISRCYKEHPIVGRFRNR